MAMLPLWMSACTLGPGDWFATLEPGFEARFVARPEREAGGGWQRLNTNYEAKVLQAVITFEGVQLLAQSASGSGGGGTFDPSSPPPGYTLCHNGHCHHEDGRLVPYEEIEAELSGGGGGARTAVSLPIGQVDLLNPVRLTPSCDPDCGLPLVHLRRARTTVTQVALEGLVRDGQTPPRLNGETSWRWEMTGPSSEGAPLAILEGELDVPADRKHPPHIELTLSAELTARLLDDVDWAAAVMGVGFIDVSLEANRAAREQLRTNLAETELKAAVQRSNSQENTR
jgi:hypothetical protein